jgi:hypothetical protein
MAEPRRIQRKRTKGWRMPEGAVYVGRPTLWGNPWQVDAERATLPATNQYRATATECVRLYRDWVSWGNPHGADIDGLRGKDLACWCPLDQPCHADVLLEIANGASA